MKHRGLYTSNPSSIEQTLLSIDRIDSASRPVKRPCDCGICGERYRAETPFERFCRRCREESELYHFAEWMLA